MVLQVALNFTDASAALHLTSSSVVDNVEAGTSLIKHNGIAIVSHLREAAPHATIVAGLKSMDDGPFEVTLAFDADAGLMTVLACPRSDGGGHRRPA